jgi:hypothetical protein
MSGLPRGKTRLVLAVALCLAAPAGPAGRVAIAQEVPAASAAGRPRTLADSVRPYLVFVPRGETWFVAASRGKRMLLDIGRVDLEVRRDTALTRAFREVVAATSPVPVTSTFILRTPWGIERVRGTGVESWNGRITIVLQGSAMLDSMAGGRDPVTATAQLEAPGRDGGLREIGLMPSTTPRCARDPASGAYAERVRAVRDSLEAALRRQGLPIYERLSRRVAAASSQVAGCFGDARVILAVSLRAGSAEWVRERVVAIDTLGRVRALAVEDFRFQAHDLLHALDADGDGIDDVAAIGRQFLAGGTSVLRYRPRERRLTRIAAGFSWENR